MNPLKYLTPFIARDDLIIAVVAFSTFLVMVMVWRALLVRNPMAGRLRSLERRRQGLRSEALGGTRRRQSEARAGRVLMMRSLIERMNLMRSSATGSATAKLEQAGFRSRDALIVYLFLKLVLPVLAGILAVTIFNILNIYHLQPLQGAGASIMTVLFLSYAPDLYIRNAAQKRQAKLQKGIPDGLDLMVICSEAGLSLDATLARVSRELGTAYPELSDELSLTSVELGFLPDRAQALNNLARRSNLSAFRNMVTTLVQTEKYGTPVAQSLRVLASDFRTERMLRAEAKAAKLPATLTVPMVLFIMPALFVVLLGPAVLRTIDSMSRL